MMQSGKSRKLIIFIFHQRSGEGCVRDFIDKILNEF